MMYFCVNSLPHYKPRCHNKTCERYKVEQEPSLPKGEFHNPKFGVRCDKYLDRHDPIIYESLL